MNLTQIQEDIAQGEGLHHFGEITLANLRPFAKNPALCKFMIQLGRFDQLGSGVTNINKYLPLYAKGAKPVFNETRHGFELTIPLADGTEVKTGPGPSQAQVEAQEAQVGAQVQLTSTEKGLLRACFEESQNGRTLAEAVGYISRTGNFKRALEKLLEDKLLEMTIPDKPTSRLQKYRLTPKGKQRLEVGR